MVGTGSGLSMQTRAEITSRYARAYAKASKKDKRRGSLTRSGCRGLEPGQRPQRGGRPTPSAPRGTSPGALLAVNLPCIHRLHETRGDSRQWHAVETRSNPLMA